MELYRGLEIPKAVTQRKVNLGITSQCFQNQYVDIEKYFPSRQPFGNGVWVA